MIVGAFPLRAQWILVACLLGALIFPGGARAEDTSVVQELSIASANAEMGGGFAQDLAEVLGRRFSARLRIIPILSGSPELTLADLCAGKADLAILPAGLPNTAARCPRRKTDAKKRGLRLVAKLGRGAVASDPPWLLVAVEGNRRAVPAVETLVALMFPNVDVLAAGGKAQRWSDADVFENQSEWPRHEAAALWVAGFREQCRERPQDPACGSVNGVRK